MEIYPFPEIRKYQTVTIKVYIEKQKFKEDTYTL